MTTPEEEGEGSDHWSRARRRRRRTRVRRPSSEAGLPETPASSQRLSPPAPSTAGQPEPSASSQQRRPPPPTPSRALQRRSSHPSPSQSESAETCLRGRRAGPAKEKSPDMNREADDAAERTSNRGGQPVAASASDASKRAKKGRSRARNEQQRKRGKRVRTTDEDRLGEETASRRLKRRNVGDLAVAAASASADTEHASDASSAVSSPIRRPYFKQAVVSVSDGGEETLEPLTNISQAILNTYEEHEAKYNAKRRSHLKLITLERPRLRFGSTLEYGEEIALKSAKYVLGMSSYIDGNLLAHASGFIIDWDPKSKDATVITSALLIRTKSPSIDEWLARDEFAPLAEVHVHLLDKEDTTLVAELIHCHKHYNFAFFKIKMDVAAQIPPFNAEVKLGQDIFVLGRDENRNLILDYGMVLRRGPSCFERHHNVLTSCQVNERCLGGPVIDLNGQFLGMMIRPVAFIPSDIILKCLAILKKNEYSCLPRLHTGMKFSAIKFLEPVHKEKLSRKCNIHAGLIVTEVSDGSIAEKVGIRIGDVLECWNGVLISTTYELENLLLSICKKHLDNGGGIGSVVEIPVRIYHVRKDSHRTVNLMLKLRDDVEVVATGEYDVSAAHHAMVSHDDRYSGKIY